MIEIAAGYVVTVLLLKLVFVGALLCCAVAWGIGKLGLRPARKSPSPSPLAPSKRSELGAA